MSSNTGFYERLHKIMFPAAAEAVGGVVVIAFLAGVINSLFKLIIRYIATKFGVENVLKTQESWAWIGQRLYMSLERMEADRVAFYTISNGTPYFSQIEWADMKLNMEVSNLKKIVNALDPSDIFLNDDYKIISHNTNKISHRGVNKLPDELDVSRFKNLLYIVVETNSVGEYFTADLPESSYLRKLFMEYGIEGYIILPVESQDKTRLYGFIIYTYSDVKLMPNNLITRKGEHLSDVKSIITNEYKSILDMSFSAKWKKFKSKFKNLFHLKNIPRQVKQGNITNIDKGKYYLLTDFAIDSVKKLSNSIEHFLNKSQVPITIIFPDDCIIDSSGIGEIFNLAQMHKLKFNGQKLKLENLCALHKKIFNMAKLYNYIDY
jgi:hypothetical protein